MLKVGDRLFVVARDRHKDWQGYAIVSKVGKKYFYLDNDDDSDLRETKFLIEDKTEVTVSNRNYRIDPSYFIYDSEEVYLNEIERGELLCFLRNAFASVLHKLPLQKLQKIKAIIEQGEEKPNPPQDGYWEFVKRKEKVDAFLKRSSYASLGLEKIKQIQHFLGIEDEIQRS